MGPKGPGIENSALKGLVVGKQQEQGLWLQAQGPPQVTVRVQSAPHNNVHLSNDTPFPRSIRTQQVWQTFHWMLICGTFSLLCPPSSCHRHPGSVFFPILKAIVWKLG